MRRRFFFGLLVVVALIWGPMWAWSHFDLENTPWHKLMLFSEIVGIGLGGYLLWTIAMRALLGFDGD